MREPSPVPICTPAGASPSVPGKVCAWCRPGVNPAEGHGICLEHLAQELAAAGLKPPSPHLLWDRRPEPLSFPEETTRNHE